MPLRLQDQRTHLRSGAAWLGRARRQGGHPPSFLHVVSRTAPGSGGFPLLGRAEWVLGECVLQPMGGSASGGLLGNLGTKARSGCPLGGLWCLPHALDTAPYRHRSKRFIGLNSPTCPSR